VAATGIVSKRLLACFTSPCTSNPDSISCSCLLDYLKVLSVLTETVDSFASWMNLFTFWLKVKCYAILFSCLCFINFKLFPISFVFDDYSCFNYLNISFLFRGDASISFRLVGLSSLMVAVIEFRAVART